MFLKRIQVPDFKALKNIDISFEEELTPHVFPLGSQNGGGKSTLLQLIFVLLHCSGDPKKHIYIQNMIRGCNIQEGEDHRILAQIDLELNGESLSLSFVIASPQFIDVLLGNQFESGFSEFEYIRLHLDFLSQRKKEAQQASKLIKEKTLSSSNAESDRILKRKIEKLISPIKLYEHDNSENLFKSAASSDQLASFLKDYQDRIDGAFDASMSRFNEIEANLLENSHSYLFDYKSDSTQSTFNIFMCETGEKGTKINTSGWNYISSRIFLAFPRTQVFHFTPPEQRKLFFENENNGLFYEDPIASLKRKLNNLFTFDSLPNSIITDLFIKARDLDFSEVRKTGHYGSNYHKLVVELRHLFHNKKINVDSDLFQEFIIQDSDGQLVNLLPEDLSHGELKRLGLYLWIKYYANQDSIVLIDEVESGFHPDWQYQIVNDLVEWAPTNQFILATHSYELCQAVTPRHVKELTPKLLKTNQESKLSTDYAGS